MIEESQANFKEKRDRTNELKNFCNLAILLAEDEQSLLNEFCNILTDLGGYALSWIAYCSSEVPEIKAIGNSRCSKSETKLIIENDIKEIPEIILNGSVRIISSFKKNDPSFKASILTSLFLPVRNSENLKFVCCIYSFGKDDFSTEEIQNLNDMLLFLSFGIDSLRTKRKNEIAEKNLQNEKEELSVTLKSLAEGVITTDLSGNITLLNRSAEDILELQESDISGKYIFEIIPIPDLTNNKADITFYIKDYRKFKDSAEKKISYYLPNGKTKILTIIGTEIRDTYANIKGFVFVISDDTEKIRIENQLSLSQKMESIGLLAAGIAHEINTPLQYIGDNTQFIKEGFKSFVKYISFLENAINNNLTDKEILTEIEKTKETLEIEFLNNEIFQAIEQSQSGINQVSKIVLAMKDFSHPNRNDFNYSDINKCIESTVTISKNTWKYNADVETILDAELPPVYCLIDELQQVILNMLVNSVHAVEEKKQSGLIEKGLISIKTGHSDNTCIITIKDNGCGISEENIRKIYDPFFTTKEVGKGTGQGLSITHDIIVNKHNGEISVESEMGIGTIFTIKLKIDKNET